VTVCNDLSVNANTKARYARLDIAEKVVDIKSALNKNRNKSEAARSVGVPRSTARYWLNRKAKTGLSPDAIAFFESPAGTVVLHQLTIAAQFAITQLAGGGVDIYAQFLELSLLDRLVASSHGTLHEQNVAMEDAINQFGLQERQTLAAQMPEKEISVCEDETFHPEICLVAIEPVSNFILVEEYSEKCDSATWTAAINRAISDLRVKIIQSTSDEGTGLVKHATKDLEVHHSSDLFHGLQEITRAISAPFNSKIKQAVAALDESKMSLVGLENELKKYTRTNQSPPDSWTGLDQKITNAEENIAIKFEELQEVTQLQDDAKEAKIELGKIYHPYDLNTGTPQPVEIIKELIESKLTKIELAAIDAQLPERSMDRLKKARRVFNLMMSTIVFYWATVARYVTELGLSPELTALMNDVLIPGLYLQKASKKAKSAAERKRLAKLASELLARLDIAEVWCNLPPAQCDRIRAVAHQCAQLFQRSSSCVEGRNGYLSLRHHSSHLLSKRKLGALTVIHNYFIKRSDKTTAAERFFESKPSDLFEYLLGNLDIATRPAAKRRDIKMAA